MVVDKPLVVVTAVTGKQGKAVANALLCDPNNRYRVRGTVRHFQPDLTKELEDKGLEVVEADFDDTDKLKAAFQGAHAAFVYTTPVESPECEIKHGLAVAKAAKECGVQHLVFSSLPDLTEATNKKFDIPFFSNKATIEKEIRKMEFNNFTFILPGLFWQNLYEWNPPCLEEDKIVFALPAPADAPIPYIDVRDVGPAVAHILCHPRDFKGLAIPFYAEYVTPAQIAEGIEQVTGKPTEYKQLAPEEALKMGFLPDLIKAFQAIGECGYYSNIADCDELHAQLCTNLRLKKLNDYLNDTDWQTRWKMVAKNPEQAVI